MKKNIAFIPVRGGSKSIPLKNIKFLHGQPLVLWAVQEALLTESIDEVWVSTDSKEIERALQIVESSKFHVFERNPNNAQDTSSTEDALLEFINARSLTDETIVLIQATSPFTKSQDFENALIKFYREGYDSLLSVVETKRFYWHKSDAKPVNYDFNQRPRRQDFEGYFMENGAFYVSSSKNILSAKNRLSGKIGYYTMPEFSGVEIDEPLDWEMVGYLMYLYKYQPKYY